MSLIGCKNVGCPMTFTWKMQMYRHLDKCEFLPVENNKKYEQRDNGFCCLTCNKVFKHQSNATRHSKTCVVKYMCCHEKRILYL